MLRKCFSFFQLRMCFALLKKLQNPNLQCRYGHRDNNECEIVSEELSDDPFQMLYICFYTFIIIKPISKFGFRFPNVGDFITNFTF